MSDMVHIGEAAQILGVTPEHLRALERAGRIPPARRDLNGRTYTPFDNCNRATIGWRGGAGEPRAVNARALLDNRRSQDMRLQVDSEHLMVTPAGVIPYEVKGTLAEHKPKLLKLLGWEQRELREADGRDLLIRWSEHPSCMKLHDLMDGSWHQIRAAKCLPLVVESANKHRKRGGGGR